jgi:hypothetical protein
MIKTVDRLGGALDKGMPEGPRSYFYQYVIKVREALGAKKHVERPSMNYPNDPNKANKPDIVMVTPQRLFAAMERPGVQAAYNDYRVSRDRAEFEAAGKLKEWEALREKARGPVAIKAPTMRAVSLGDRHGIEIAYAEVPENFVPTVEIPFSDSIDYLYYKMTKREPDSLTEMHVWSGIYGSTRAMYDATPAIRKIVFEDADKVRATALPTNAISLPDRALMPVGQAGSRHSTKPRTVRPLAWR